LMFITSAHHQIIVTCGYPFLAVEPKHLSPITVVSTSLMSQLERKFPKIFPKTFS
jgi:hypothetical protein